MIVTVRDPNILSNLDPKRITAYLQTRGWLLDSQINNSESVWVILVNGKEYDITLPLNPKIRSYALRMAEILNTLEKVEGISQLDILSDLVTFIPNTEIQGMVIRLAENQNIHNITIMGFVVCKPQQIYLTLGKEEYHLARTAYIDRLPVVCVGDLIKENDAFVFKASSFSLYNALTRIAV